MKRLIAIIIVFIITANISFAQFKDDSKPSYNSSGNLILGFINPKNFTMKHSFNISMMTTGYGNVSLTSYINSMNYKFSDRLNVSADVKFQYSPFASSGFDQGSSGALQKNLSGLFLSRASLNYKISDNAFINVEYRRFDDSDFLNNYYNPFNYRSGFNGFNYSDYK